jgi:hypothetical protein
MTTSLFTAAEAADLSEAHGLIRAANDLLLGDPDAAEAGLLGLDLAAALDEMGIEPRWIAHPPAPAEAVARASELLTANRAVLPLGVAYLLTQLQARVR